MPGEGGADPVGEDDLQAWVDGRLPPGRRAEVDGWLASRPDTAARLRVLAAQRDALRAALRPKHDEPLPARLRVADAIAERERRARRGGPAFRRVAAACAWLALGAGLGWSGRTLLPAVRSGAASRPAAVAAEAMAAHRVFAHDARRPVEVAAEQETALVRWLSTRLSRPVATPDLSALGYLLMGGRVLPSAAGEAAAQLMYQDGDGGRLTLYLRADAADEGRTEFRYAEDPDQGVSSFWWIDGGFGYAVSAERTNRAVLLRVAEAVYRQGTGGAARDRGL